MASTFEEQDVPMALTSEDRNRPVMLTFKEQAAEMHRKVDEQLRLTLAEADDLITKRKDLGAALSRREKQIDNVNEELNQKLETFAPFLRAHNEKCEELNQKLAKLTESCEKLQGKQQDVTESIDRLQLYPDAKLALDIEHQRDCQHLRDEADGINKELETVGKIDARARRMGEAPAPSAKYISLPVIPLASPAARTPTAAEITSMEADRVKTVKPDSVPQEVWDLKDTRERRIISHIGRISETDAGMVSPLPCAECVGECKESECRIYTPEARVQYCRTGYGDKCSGCLHRGGQCSLVGQVFQKATGSV
ncbi:hypothetical protein LTR95_009273 [Oleoguttula sp. CCFEE 5521]